MWSTVPMLLSGVVVGFVCGLLTFRRSLRWCPTCGETLRCPRRVLSKGSSE